MIVHIKPKKVKAKDKAPKMHFQGELYFTGLLDKPYYRAICGNKNHVTEDISRVDCVRCIKLMKLDGII